MASASLPAAPRNSIEIVDLINEKLTFLMAMARMPVNADGSTCGVMGENDIAGDYLLGMHTLANECRTLTGELWDLIRGTSSGEQS